MHKHTAIVRSETRTQTKRRPSLKAAHKMPPGRQTEIQNGWQLDMCVWGGGQSGVFCVWLRSWQRPSDGSIQTSNKDCSVQLRREADRGFTSASQLSQAAILEVNWRIVCAPTYSEERSLIIPGWPLAASHIGRLTSDADKEWSSYFSNRIGCIRVDNRFY